MMTLILELDTSEPHLRPESMVSQSRPVPVAYKIATSVFLHSENFLILVEFDETTLIFDIVPDHNN